MDHCIVVIHKNSEQFERDMIKLCFVSFWNIFFGVVHRRVDAAAQVVVSRWSRLQCRPTPGKSDTFDKLGLICAPAIDVTIFAQTIHPPPPLAWKGLTWEEGPQPAVHSQTNSHRVPNSQPSKSGNITSAFHSLLLKLEPPNCWFLLIGTNKQTNWQFVHQLGWRSYVSKDPLDRGSMLVNFR